MSYDNHVTIASPRGPTLPRHALMVTTACFTTNQRYGKPTLSLYHNHGLASEAYICIDADTLVTLGTTAVTDNLGWSQCYVVALTTNYSEFAAAAVRNLGFGGQGRAVGSGEAAEEPV